MAEEATGRPGGLHGGRGSSWMRKGEKQENGRRERKEDEDENENEK
jgi:hypothetical protein